MKIAYSTDGQSPEDAIQPAFGRCRRFLIVDDERGEFRLLPNPGAASSGGAGVRAAEALAAARVNRVVTGSVGPNARAVLERAGIAIEEGRRGAIRDHLPALPRPSASGSAEAVPSRAVSAAPRNAAGWCFCERCGYRSAEDEGVPCFKLRCPDCGAALERRFTP